LGTDGLGYICKKRHTSTTLDKPITGAKLVKYWELNNPVSSGNKTWTATAAYIPSTRVAGTDSQIYECIASHIATTADKPISGVNWATYWRLYTGTTDCLAWQASKEYGRGLRMSSHR